MTRDTKLRCFFVLAVLSRVTLSLLGAHWALVVTMLLIGLPPGRVAQPFAAFCTLVSIAVAIGLVLGARTTAGQQRMRRGPEVIQKHPLAVLAAGVVSAIGGQFLFVSGYHVSASWALNLSFLVVVFELAPVLGTLWLAEKA